MFNLVIALFPKGAKASKAATSNSGKTYTLGGDPACINWVIFAALSAVKMHRGFNHTCLGYCAGGQEIQVVLSVVVSYKGANASTASADNSDYNYFQLLH
jgi:hypothetical protein